ncbi:PAS domain-containing sensor histidine kinase [Evansella cellulosilytica]|uniref:histidine kinase n=1 Tax=Evansella cellulosilytica (strain ATCC 21833 / DSM 2522 / FERM P-1141 / JCM 9156 / N-4) TaxID=649639 RepID=E6U0S7_EVAC2|nr:PAS domain-containing sensor histidine kinase [Evansella cellulosilytica]ADU29125.1 PAS/PAC sensor signal transduction histidine kinase [Evansella cellulosilytica DSM 2522]
MTTNSNLSRDSIFLSTFIHTPVAMMLVSLDGTVLKTNRSCQETFGYTEEQLEKLKLDEILHPEDIEQNTPLLERLITNDRPLKFNGRVIYGDGILKQMVFYTSLAKSELGEPLYYIYQILENTNESFQSELNESKERYKSLFKYNPDMIYSMDLDGYYTSVNPAFEQVLGYSKCELLNGKLNYQHLTPKEKLKETIRHFNAAVEGEIQHYEMPAVSKDGEVIMFDITNIPIVVDGKIVGVYGIAKDITARKKSEQELIITKKQLESFIENNVDPIFIYDLDDKLIKVNKAFEKTYGWKKEEVLGLSYKDMPVLPTNMYSNMQKDLKLFKMTFKSLETQRVKKDGSLIHVDISGFPIHDEEGHIAAWAFIHRDLTETKMAEEMMINSEKLSIAGQLAAGIAHEIRNPLTAIKGFLQLLRPDFVTKEKYMNIISTEIERIEMIISELLILSKPQEIHYSKTNIVSIIEEVKMLLETQAILKGVEINTEFYCENTYIYCEKNQLKQVCINFIKNAIEAMPNGGNLYINVTENREENGIFIHFKDEGKGIPKEKISKIGHPFYTTKSDGTGLGFMVSKRIVEHHEGYVEIDSELNVGTTITVFLPMEQLSFKEKE